MAARKKLVNAIVESSESKNFELACKEWTLFYTYIDDEITHCKCGQQIKERCFITNVKNNNELMVGNSCIKKFINEEIGETVKSIHVGLKFIQKNEFDRHAPDALMDDALSRNFINLWEVNFKKSIAGSTQRKLSNAQLRTLQSINAKLLKAYSDRANFIRQEQVPPINE
jgi:hypothetical protein